MAPAPPPCGVMMGLGVMVTLVSFGALGTRRADFGLSSSSFVKKRTALVTPSVIATPNIMSATSALFSPASAELCVGFLSKSDLLPSAAMPNPVPNPSATTARPPVMIAGSLLFGFAGGGGGGGGWLSTTGGG